MDPTRLPHVYRYNTPVPQYTFNPMSTPNYGWPNAYPNYMSSYPMIPLYTYPNVPMYNQYETPLIIPTRYPQPNVIPQQRMPYANPIYGIPQTQTTTHIISTEPVQPPEEAMKATKTKQPFSRNSKLRWSINKGHSKGSGIACNATDQSEMDALRRTNRKPVTKFYTAGKVATKYLKRRQKSSKRQRNPSHNTTGATTELSAIANDGTHGNYKHLAVIVSDNGDPNDSEFETCDESEEDIYEESNWNVEDKESSHENSKLPTKKSTSMDYTVIANDKSYSYVNYNPSVRATFKRKVPRKLGIRRLSRKLGDLVVSKQSTPVETTSNQQVGNEKFTTDKIISRVLEASNNLMDKSRSPELWWDRSTDLGYDVISKGKSPAPSLKEVSSRDVSVANSEDILTEVLTDCDENGNLTMAKAHDYEVIEFIDLKQKQTTKDPYDNESTLTQSKNGPILNSQSQYLSATACNNANYNVPNNTPANFDSVLGESHTINQTAPEVRSTYQQRKLLEVDWNAIQKILRNMASQKSKPVDSTTSKSINPSISGQDSAILAYGKVSKINSQRSNSKKISDSERSALFSKYRNKDSFNFPPTQFGSSDSHANFETNKSTSQNDCKVTSANLTTSSNVENSKTDISDVTKYKDKTYLVMHATLPSTPIKVKAAFESLRNKTFQSVSSPTSDLKTPKRGLSRRPSTCTKVKFANEDALSRSLSMSNLPESKNVSMSFQNEKTSKRKLDTTPNDVSQIQGRATKHNNKDPNLVTNVTPTNRSKTTSKKKFEMIRNLFNSGQSSNDKVIRKTYNRRSLPTDLNRNAIVTKAASSIDDSAVCNSKSHDQPHSADESPQIMRRCMSTNLLATPNKLVKSKPHSLKTTASMLNLTTPSRKNKILYQKAKPPSTPFMIPLNGIANDKFSETKSAPSTPSGILKNTKFHTFDIDIGEESKGNIENYESTIAEHAEIVTIDDVAASFTGNEGDDEASSVSTKTSEHRYDAEANEKPISSENKQHHNLPVTKECNILKLVTAKPFHSKNHSDVSSIPTKLPSDIPSKNLRSISKLANNENDLSSDTSTIATKICSDMLSNKPITKTSSGQEEAIRKENVSSADKFQMVADQSKTTHNSHENLKQTIDSKTVCKEDAPCKNPNFSAEKIKILMDQTKQNDLQKVKFVPLCNSTKNFTFQEKRDESLSTNSTRSFSTSNDQSKSFVDCSTSCNDYYSLSIDGDSGFSLLNAADSGTRIANKQKLSINTPQTALFQAGLGRIRSPTMIQSSSMLLLGQGTYANTKQAKIKHLRSHFSQPTLAHPPTLVQPIAGAKPFIISNHDARTNINMNIVDGASAYQVYPCLAYKPVQNPKFKYGSVKKYKKTNRSFSTSRSYIGNKNSTMKKRHFINIQKTTMNFSHPPLTVYNTSLEHPKVSALKISNKRTKPQKPTRKRLAGVCRLTKEDMENIAKVATPSKINTLKINLSDPDNGTKVYTVKSNRTNIKSAVSQRPVATSCSSMEEAVKSKSDLKTADSENDHTETITLCDEATPTNTTKSKGKGWRSFFPRIGLSGTPSMSSKGGKHKTSRSGSIMKRSFKKSRKLSKSVTTTPTRKLKKPKDYCELNRALYKTSFLCMAPIESKSPSVTLDVKTDISKEGENTPNQPSSGNVGDYFGREFTSSTATIKKRSARRSVGSTPGVRINSETGDFLDQTKGFGTFLCSTTIGDNISEVEDKRQTRGSFEGSFRIHKKLFSQSESQNFPNDCSTEIN